MKKRKRVKADVKTYDAVVQKAVKQHETKDERYGGDTLHCTFATLTYDLVSIGLQEGAHATREAHRQAHQGR